MSQGGGSPSELGSGPASRRRAALVGAVFLGTQSTHALATNTADTLFFSRFGVEHLPLMYIVLGLVTMAVLIGFGMALGSLARSVLYPGLLALTGASLLLVRAAIGLDRQWVYAVVWLVASLGVLVTLTFMWSLASDAADARSAKRLYPMWASAGILGGVAGNLATGPLTAALGAPNVLVVTAVILGITAVVTWRAAATLTVAPATSRAAPGEGIRGALAMAWSHSLLRFVALAFFVASALFYAVAFPFSTQVAESFDSEADIASYLGVFSAAATAATFFVSLFLVNRIFSRLGVVMAWFLVGLVYVAGFSLWLASLTLVTASIFRFSQWVLATSVDSTARSAMFNVLRPEQRATVMAGFAAVPAQLGVVLAGVLLWAGARLGAWVNSAVGLVLALILTWAIWQMRRRYSEALVGALRQGEVDAFVCANPGVAQLDGAGEGVAVAVRGTTDDNPLVRRLAVEMLGRLDAVDRYGELVSRLDDPELDVRLAALDSMERIASAHPGDSSVRASSDVVLAAVTSDGRLDDAPARSRAAAAAWLVRVDENELAAGLVDSLVTSGDAAHRVAGAGAIARSSWEPVEGTAAGLLATDQSQAVRAAATAAVASISGADSDLQGALLDPSPRVRIAAAEAWAGIGGPPGAGLDLLENHPPWTWEAATVALGARAGEIRGDVLEWAAGQLETLARVHADRDTIVAVADPAMPATNYLAYLLTERVGAARRVAIRVLGLLESEETVRLVISGIGSDDVEERAQALEAAESFGGALGHRVIPLLEAGPTRAPLVGDVIDRLVSDDDPYLRALAVRCVMEVAAREWADRVRPLIEDPNDLVEATARDIAGRMEFKMSETLDTLGRMDRMLLLRRVSIFDELLPEDLDRLAELASERVYDDGEVMLARGDVGGDLLAIVEGSVDIGPAGGEAIQRLGPDEQVGELTALSGQARPTDAVAVGRVRALAISGAAFADLIVDRPDVARLLLASLAGRLADALGYERSGDV